MMISRNSPNSGACFAWLPVQTPEGKVWLEWVHFEWQDHGFGGWSYTRLLARRGRRCKRSDHYYTTPTDPSRCKNYNPDGPTPCHHPHCECFHVPATEIGARPPSKEFWDAWFKLPMERRLEICREMSREPL